MSCSVTCTGETSPNAATASQVFSQALSLYGAPSPGRNNLNILLNHWYPYEGVGGYNPLGIEGAGSCGFWNTSCVSCFCSVSEGAQNYAGEWQGYPAVGQALRGDWTIDQWACSPAIIAEVNLWGTHGFASELQARGCAVSPTPTPTPMPPTPTPSPTAAPGGGGASPLALAALAGGALLVGLGLWQRSAPGRAMITPGGAGWGERIPRARSASGFQRHPAASLHPGG